MINEYGGICMDSKKIMLSAVLAEQRVGVIKVEDQIWQVNFKGLDLAYFGKDSCRYSPCPIRLGLGC